MSVDNRIVRMKFDNAQFEANVSKSMSTLDKLKEKLNFKESSQAIDDWQTKISKVDFSAMENSLKFLQGRFSATGEFIYKIWDNITDRGLAAFKKLEAATIGQIKSGGWTRAMNLANAQFQVEGLNYSWEKIFAAADYGVTDTAYGLDSAAKAASQLAASGIDFEKTLETVNGVEITQMHKALRGISGLAAMTNSSFDDIAHVFTRIAGSGRVFATDLNSIATRGINATATLAKYLNKSEAEIKDMVSKAQIDFKTFADAMDEAYGEHAKEANATFTGSLSNMKAALSRIGAIFAQPVINNTNKFFNAITSKIKVVQKSLQDVTKTNEKTKKSYVEQTRFATHFAETYQKAVDVAVALVEKLDMSWFQQVADKMDKAVMKIRNALDFIDERFGLTTKKTEETAKENEKSLDKMVATQEEYNAAMTILFKDRTLSGKKRVKWLENQGLDPKRVQKYIDSVVAAGYNVKKASIQVEKGVTKAGTAVGTVAEEMAKFPISIEEFNSMGAAGQEEFLKNQKNLTKFQKKYYTAHEEWLKTIKARQDDATRSAYAFKVVSQEYARLSGKSYEGNEALFNVAEMTHGQRDTVFRTYPELVKVYKEAYNTPKNYANFGGIFKNLASATSNIVTNIKIIWNTAKSAFKEVFSFSSAISGTEKFTGKLAKLTKSLIITESFAGKIRKVFVLFFKAIRFGITTFANVTGKLMDFISWLFKADDAVDKTGKSVKKTEGFFTSLFKIIKKIGSGLWDYISNIDVLFEKIGQTKGVQRLRDALSNLFTTAKDGVNDVVEPAKGAFARFADSFEMPSVDDVANAIGWIADKIAWLIEKIPEWSAKVAEFFGFIVLKVKEFIGDIEFADIGGHIKNGIIDAFTIDDDEKASITNFFTDIKDAIYNFFTNTDWSKVGDVSKFALVLATFMETIRMFHNAGSLFKNVSNMFSGISGIFKTARKAISGFALGFDIMSFGYLFAGLGILVGSIAVLLFAISQMPAEKADTAVTMVTMIIGAAIAISAIVASAKKNKAVASNTGSTGLFNNVKLQVGAIGELAMFLAGVGVMLKLLVDAMKELAEFDTAGLIQSFGIVVGTLAIITLFALAIIKLLQERGKQVKLMERAGGIFSGLGVFFVLAGVSMKLIASAMKTMSKDVNDYGFAAALSTLIVMLGGMAALIYATSKLKPSAAWAAAGIMAAFGISMNFMLVRIGILAALGWERVLPAAGSIGVILLSLAAFIVGIGKALKDVGKAGAKPLVAAILAMGATVWLIGNALSTVFDSLNDETSSGKWDTMWTALIPIIATMGAMLVMLGLMVHMLNKSLDKGKATKGRGKVTADDILEVAASFLIMAVAVGIIGKTISMLSKVKINGKALAVLGVILGVFTGLGLLAGYKKDFAAGILSVGTAFLLLGISLTALGAGIWLAGAGMPAFAEGLGKLFEVIEAHKLVALIVLAALIVAVIAISKALDAFANTMIIVSKPLSGLFDLIAKGGEVIIKAIRTVISGLKTGGKKILDWFKALSPVMKGVIVTLVMTLLATALDLAPTVVENFIKIIFAIIDTFLKYVDDIAMKFVVLILRVITALANAISRNANAIVNAFLAVAKALLRLAVVALSKILKALFNVLGNLVNKLLPGVGDFISNLGDDLGDALGDVADRMTEGIDKAIEDTNTEISELDEQINTTTGTIGTQGAALDTLAEKFGIASDKAGELEDKEKRLAYLQTNSEKHSFEWYRTYSEERGDVSWFQKEYDPNKIYADTIQRDNEAIAEITKKYRQGSPTAARAIAAIREQHKEIYDEIERYNKAVAAMQSNELKSGALYDLTWRYLNEMYTSITGDIKDFGEMSQQELQYYFNLYPELKNILDHQLMHANMDDYFSMAEARQNAATTEHISLTLADYADKLTSAGSTIADKYYGALSDFVETVGGPTGSEWRAELFNMGHDTLKAMLAQLPENLQAYMLEAINDPEAFAVDEYITKEERNKVNSMLDSLDDIMLAQVKAHLTTGISYDILIEQFSRLPENYRSALVKAINDPEAFAVDQTLSSEAKSKINEMVSQLYMIPAAALSRLDAKDEVASVFNELMSISLDPVAEWQSGVEDFVEDRQASIYEGLARAAKEKSGALQQEVDNTQAGIYASMAENAKKAGESIGNNLAEGYTEGIDGESTEVKSHTHDWWTDYVIDPSKKACGTHSPSTVTKEIGRNLAEGLILGLNGESSNVKSTVEKWTQNNLIKIVMDKLQIHSPSEVMAKIGSFTTEGLIVGLKDKATALKDTATGMISGLVSQFSNGGTDISQAFTSMLGDEGGELFNALSGGYQMDMGIQPVLDSSSIMNGTDSIGAMLGNQSLMINGFSGELAADISSLDSRNSQGVNEIRQLRNEMSDMSDALRNMQIYLDTGALVGGIADPLDNRLGARAIYARRGN